MARDASLKLKSAFVLPFFLVYTLLLWVTFCNSFRNLQFNCLPNITNYTKCDWDFIIFLIYILIDSLHPFLKTILAVNFSRNTFCDKCTLVHHGCSFLLFIIVVHFYCLTKSSFPLHNTLFTIHLHLFDILKSI